MPTVRRDKDGFNIISRRRGRYITHQLSDDAAEALRDRYGSLDGLEIDVATLIELIRSNGAYTRRQRRQQRWSENRQKPSPTTPPRAPQQPAAARFTAPVPPLAVPTTPQVPLQPTPVPAGMRECQRCH